jgi:hypothetical protein
MALFNTIINLLTAIGTISVAILAIWGDWVRSRWAGPKLTLVPHDNFRGTFMPRKNNAGVIFYHLKVVNRRYPVNATRCRVMLKTMKRADKDGIFKEVHLACPLPFVWSPSEISPPCITVGRDQVLDFGRIEEGSNHFLPQLHLYTGNFGGYVYANEAMRYGLEIESDNFISPRLQVFEVKWNGKWSEDPDRMSENLQIREVTTE